MKRSAATEMEISFSASPMVPNSTMVAKSTSPSTPEENVNMLGRESSLEFSWIDSLAVPVFAIDLSQYVTAWNRRTAEMTGIPSQNIIECQLSSICHSGCVKSLEIAMTEIENGADSSVCDLTFPSYGALHHFHVKLSAQLNSAGQTVGIVCFAEQIKAPPTASPITPISECELPLLNSHSSREVNHHSTTQSGEQSSEEQANQINDSQLSILAMARELRQLLDTANAPIFGVDTTGRVNEWNDKTAEITGFSRDEAFNQPLVETFIVPALQPSVQEVLYNALRGRVTSNFELEIRTKANETRYLLVNATTRRDTETKVVGVVVIAQDVTEACKHDRAVAAMANELRQFIDTANAPIFGIDRDG